VTDRVTPELLSALCHELRGPLGALGNWVHVLGVPNLDPAVRARALSGLTEDVRAMSGVIDQLSALAAALSGPKADITIDAGSFLRGLVEEKAKESGHQTRLRVSEPSLRVLGDPARLREMLGLFLGPTHPADEVAVTGDAGRVVIAITLSDLQPRSLSIALARVMAEHQAGDLVAVVAPKHTLLRFRLRRAP